MALIGRTGTKSVREPSFIRLFYNLAIMIELGKTLSKLNLHDDDIKWPIETLSVLIVGCECICHCNFIILYQDPPSVRALFSSCYSSHPISGLVEAW